MRLESLLKATAIPILTFGISGCVISFGESKVVVTRNFCSIAQPIRASRQDTAKTLEQVKLHNAVYDCVCKDICPKTLPRGVTVTAQ